MRFRVSTKEVAVSDQQLGQLQEVETHPEKKSGSTARLLKISPEIQFGNWFSRSAPGTKFCQIFSHFLNFSNKQNLCIIVVCV